MLFLGNVHEPDIPYTELSDLSLRFLPYLKEERSYIDIDQNYRISSKNKGYIDPLFIYNKTGYWGNEIYRFGIVYILPNGELSPVFNIRGRQNVGSYNAGQYTDVPLYDNINNRKYIEYDEESYKLKSSTIKYENVKGVVSFAPTQDADTIYSIDIRVDNETISELKKYVKGFFFVRQPRIPTVLAQV